MNKDEFSILLKKWLEEYLEAQYGDSYDINIILSDSNISKIANSDIKNHVENYSSFDFSPDILGVLKHKERSGVIELVFLNRTISSISLKEIGEMQCYCRIAVPKIAFLVSAKGLPEQIEKLLLDKSICNSLLSYSNDRNIITFKWDESSMGADPISVFPVNIDIQKLRGN